MRLLTCKQSTEEVFVLATGNGGVSPLSIYNPSSEPVTLQLRGYDLSQDLNIGLSEITLKPFSTSELKDISNFPLNSGDELSFSGNSQGHNLQYTYGFSGDTKGLFRAFKYIDTAEKYVAGTTYTPPKNIFIKAFNTSAASGELIVEAEAHEGNTNKYSIQNVHGRKNVVIEASNLGSWDSYLANNEVAHPFDMCIYTKDSTLPQYSQMKKTFADGAWAKFVNRTAGTDNPVGVHLQFRNMTNPPFANNYYRTSASCSVPNNISVNSVTKDTNGKVTDVNIDVWIDSNSDWLTPGFRMWNDGTFLNENGTNLPTQPLGYEYGASTNPAGGIGWSGSLYGDAPCYPKDASATGYLQVQIGIGDTEYKAGWSGQPRWNQATSAFNGYGSTVYYSSWVPYDPIRQGYWLDLGAGN